MGQWQAQRQAPNDASHSQVLNGYEFTGICAQGEGQSTDRSHSSRWLLIGFAGKASHCSAAVRAVGCLQLGVAGTTFLCHVQCIAPSLLELLGFLSHPHGESEGYHTSSAMLS